MGSEVTVGRTLLVQDRGADDSDRPEVRQYARLDLSSGELRCEDRAVSGLWSAHDDHVMREAAQRVSERFWSSLPPTSPLAGSREMALLVGAVSKLDVYRDFCRTYRTLLLVERASSLTAADIIEWRSDTPPPDGAWGGRVRLRKPFANGVRQRFTRSYLRERVIGWLKRSKWEWSARTAAGVVERMRGVRLPQVRTDVLGLFDVRNPGMITNVALVLAAIREQGFEVLGVSMQPASGHFARGVDERRRVVPFAAYTRWRDVIDAVSLSATVTAELRRTEQPETDDHVLIAARQAIRELHRGYVAQTLLDHRTVERMMAAIDPRAIVLASDAHRYSRMVVAVARRMGIPTFVVQHGALVVADFYLPVVADRMLAWGPWCRDWFVRRGTDRARVAAVGFVRGGSSPPAGRTHNDASTVLYAAQPLAERLNRDLLQVLRATLEARPGLNLVIRPHPGEGRRVELERLLSGWPNELAGRFSVSAAGVPLETDFERCDAVVTAQSTVGIDALAAGKPVLLLRHPEIEEPIPFVKFGCVLPATDSVELQAGLTALAEEDTRLQLAESARRFLDAYVGPVGRAAALKAAATVLSAWR